MRAAFSVARPFPGLIIILLLITAPHIQAQIPLFAAPAGTGEKCSLELPCSLLTARDQARTLNDNMTEDIVIYLRGGTYLLGSPLQFTQQDSGTNGHNVLYQAYEREEPEISGGKLIAGWSLFDVAKNIYRANVGSLSSRQFYVNGVRAVRARSVTNPPDITKTDDGYSTTNSAMEDWRNQDDIEIVAFNEWKSFRCGVLQINGSSITMKQPCWKNSQFPSRPMGAPTWVENAFELLDEAGEWYLDRPSGFLYYKPRPGEDMSSATAILPLPEALLALTGTLDAPIHNIQFVGLTFSYATWLRPLDNDGFVEVQANYTLMGDNANYDDVSSWSPTPAAVIVTAGKSIRLEQNTFIHLGAAGLALEYGSQSNTITNNRFADISGSGIRIGGITREDHHPSDLRRVPLNNVVSGNYVHDVAVEYHGAVGILVTYTDGTIISHNEIAYLPYTGISLGWGWGWTDAGGYDGYLTPTISRNNRVEYNLIHDCMRVLRDGGAIYTLSRQPDSTIHDNFIYGQVNPVAGIYLDEGSSGFSIYNNVIRNAPHWIFFHLASYNDARSNYADAPEQTDGGGSNNTAENNTNVTDNSWPPPAQMIMSQAGLEVPILLVNEAGRAIAIDSVTFQSEPFHVLNLHNFSADGHTRVLVFVRKLSPESNARVMAEDVTHKVFPLTIEYIGRVPGFDWLTELSVRLPDGLSGEIVLSVSAGPVASNKAAITIE